MNDFPLFRYALSEGMGLLAAIQVVGLIPTGGRIIAPKRYKINDTMKIIGRRQDVRISTSFRPFSHLYNPI
jgi:hypothetical protein